MQKINELELAKELIKFPSITPIDAGVMSFFEKKLKKLGFIQACLTNNFIPTNELQPDMIDQEEKNNILNLFDYVFECVFLF